MLGLSMRDGQHNAWPALRYAGRMLLTPFAFARLCRSRERLSDLSRPISVNQLAQELGLSPFQFIRQFQALFGQTPLQLRIQARIDLAKTLLERDRDSVTGVCLEVGFSSLGSFSSSFARRVGVSPSQYRRARQKRIQVPSVRLAVAPNAHGCFGLLAFLPAAAFCNFGEA